MTINIVGHDHEVSRHTISILNVVGENCLGYESQSPECRLGTMLVRRHIGHEFLQTDSMGNVENFRGQIFSETPGTVCLTDIDS